MEKISYENSDKLKEIILDEKYKRATIELLEKILKKEIKDIKYQNIKRLSNITEYEFTILKLIGKFKDENEKNIYLRLIKPGKVKESVYCYWVLMHEEYQVDTEKDKSIHKRVIISEQRQEEKFKNQILLTIDKNKEQDKYNLEINLVEIQKFIKEYKNKNNELEKWSNIIDSKKESILFVGLISDKIIE